VQTTVGAVQDDFIPDLVPSKLFI